MSNIEAQTSRGEPRLAAVEWLRLSACLGIVVFHAQAPGGHYALAGLPAFTLLTVAFAFISARGKRFTDFARARVRTLLLPWVFWSLAYAGVNTALALKNGRPALSWFEPVVFLIGPSVHLWFLPFAFVASLLVGGFVAARGEGRGDEGSGADGSEGAGWLLWLLAGGGVMAGAAWILSNPAEGARWPVPFEQYISVAAGLPAGIALAKIPAGQRSSWWKLAVFALVLSAVCVYEIVQGRRLFAIPDLIAVWGCAVAWAMPFKAGPLTLKFSRLSYGVYLTHPMFAYLAYFLLARFGLSDGTQRWILAAVIGVMSLAGSWVLRKTWFRQVI